MKTPYRHWFLCLPFYLALQFLLWQVKLLLLFSARDIPISSRDRVYAAGQTSNTVSVHDPQTNRLLGVIRLGEVVPENLSPLYRGQLLVHGMGFSPDYRTLAVVSIGSNSVAFIDTQTNQIKHITYLGRSPHEAFFTPNGQEVWVTVRGEDYVSVLDGKTYEEKLQIPVGNGPGMTIFRPDGKYGFVCSSFTPTTNAIEVATHRIVKTISQASPFCPNIAATPDGKQVWFTLKDIGKNAGIQCRAAFSMSSPRSILGRLPIMSILLAIARGSLPTLQLVERMW